MSQSTQNFDERVEALRQGIGYPVETDAATEEIPLKPYQAAVFEIGTTVAKLQEQLPPEVYAAQADEFNSIQANLSAVRENFMVLQTELDNERQLLSQTRAALWVIFAIMCAALIALLAYTFALGVAQVPESVATESPIRIGAIMAALIMGVTALIGLVFSE